MANEFDFMQWLKTVTTTDNSKPPVLNLNIGPQRDQRWWDKIQTILERIKYFDEHPDEEYTEVDKFDAVFELLFPIRLRQPLNDLAHAVQVHNCISKLLTASRLHTMQRAALLGPREKELIADMYAKPIYSRFIRDAKSGEGNGQLSDSNDYRQAARGYDQTIAAQYQRLLDVKQSFKEELDQEIARMAFGPVALER